MLQTLILGTAALGALAVGGAYIAATRGVKTPDYTVLRADGDIELRRYPPLVLAQVTRGGSRRGAVQAGFSPLARYIFAKDRAGSKIAMTAPVVQKPSADGWAVSFILPAEVSEDDAPEPSGDVALVTEPERLMASLRFSGTWTDARFEAATARLRRWIKAEGLTEKCAAEFGYYNDPFTPAFLRRNEVLLEVSE